MLLLGLLFDSEFDVIVGFAFMFLDLCNFLFLILFFNFFYLININLDADVAFFNYYFNVLSATSAFSVSWVTVRT